jgi:hypothetical protein
MITSFIMLNGRVALPLDELKCQRFKNARSLQQLFATWDALTGATIHLRYIIPRTDDILRAIEFLEWVSHGPSPLRRCGEHWSNIAAAVS